MTAGVHVAIANETCRVLGMDTHILMTKDFATDDTDALSDRLGLECQWVLR